MNKDDLVPNEYPIDNQLLVEAEIYNSGSYVHDINRDVSQYKYCIKIYNATKNDTEEKISKKRGYFYSTLKYERILRGIVAEAKMKSFKK